MIIQMFLTLLLAAIGVLVALQRTTSRIVRILILGVVATGSFFVWVPDRTTAIAERLGVGRGADLLLYIWVVLTLALILVLYLKVIELSRRMTVLTRAMAVEHARQPEPAEDEG